MGIIESIRFKHDVHAALDHHRAANDSILSLWQIAKSQDESAVARIRPLIVSFNQNADEADRYYNRLLNAFPNSVFVWTRYGGFLKDVTREEKQAAEVQEKINRASALRRDGLGQSIMTISSMDEEKSNLYSTLTTSLNKTDMGRGKSRKWHIKSNRLYSTMTVNLLILISGLIFLAVYSSKSFVGLKPTPDVGNMASTRRYGKD